MPFTASDIIKIIIAIFLPPVGVFLERGCNADFLINILLTILGYIPGIIHALYIILNIVITTERNAEELVITIEPGEASQSTNVPAIGQPNIPAVNQPSIPTVNQPNITTVDQPSVPATNQSAVPATNQPAVPNPVPLVVSPAAVPPPAYSPHVNVAGQPPPRPILRPVIPHTPVQDDSPAIVPDAFLATYCVCPECHHARWQGRNPLYHVLACWEITGNGWVRHYKYNWPVKYPDQQGL